MKLRVAILCVGAWALALGQGRQPARPPVVAPAAAPVRLPGSITNSGFARTLGESIQGRRQPPSRPGGRLYNPYLPYGLLPAYSGYPVFYYVGVPVVINQTFASPPPADAGAQQADTQQAPEPVFTGYQAPPEQSPEQSSEAAGSGPPPNSVLKPTLYLISMKDGAVQTAVAYWYEGDSLHYVGKDRQIHEAPVADVDADTSKQLNSERGIDFHFPD